ncbi:MAG: hypothetical protein SOZ34_00655, partial [Clostridia bacterium]|nr:hypothetical protein [Clostridia bacterium]
MKRVLLMKNTIDTYNGKISKIFKSCCGTLLTDTQISNVCTVFSETLSKSDICAFYDFTINKNGKECLFFTSNAVYYKDVLSNAIKCKYEEIKSVSVVHINDSDDVLKIELNDGSNKKIKSSLIDKSALKNCIDELIGIKNLKQTENNVSVDSKEDYITIDMQNDSVPRIEKDAIKTVSTTAGNYKIVNKLFDEEKFSAVRGHGFAAERANNLVDKLSGKNAQIVGDSNIKNGADRIVNGVEIQTKYCKTGGKCIAECFENGKMKYTINNGTKPMKIEVPSDKYDAAVKAMEERIKRGEVPGVSDPAEAKNIVIKGHFTYAQAVNIAKAGTVESIVYDSVNGAVVGAVSFGLSTALTFAVSIWQGEDFDTAIKTASFTGLKMGGMAFATTLFTSQLSKAGLNSALVGSSEAIARAMGPKASAVLINAFRGNAANIYGAAAMKSAAKLLRGNVITSGVTVAVMSTADVVNIFRGRISGKQLFKNIANTTTSVAAGTAGFIAGQALIPIPIVGGLIGSFVSGAAASKVSNTVLDHFIEDDADEMVGIINDRFTNLANDYLLNKEEVEYVVDELHDELNGS